MFAAIITMIKKEKRGEIFSIVIASMPIDRGNQLSVNAFYDRDPLPGLLLSGGIY